jgi:hypothetical protein
VHLVADLDDLGVEGVAPGHEGVLVSDVLEELEDRTDEGRVLGVVEEVREELRPEVGEEHVGEVDESGAQGFGDLLGEVEVGVEGALPDGLNDGVIEAAFEFLEALSEGGLL